MSKVVLVHFLVLSSVLLSDFQIHASVKVPGRDYNGRLEELLDRYFEIQKALASDSVEGVRPAVAAIVRLTEADADTDVVGRVLLMQIRRVAENMQGDDLTSTRREFSELSNRVIAAVRLSYSGGQKYYPYICRMENKSWIQGEQSVRNPYLGSSMLDCGEAVSLSRRN